jgi:hypothetical protein
MPQTCEAVWFFKLAGNGWTKFFAAFGTATQQDHHFCLYTVFLLDTALPLMPEFSALVNCKKVMFHPD